MQTKEELLKEFVVCDVCGQPPTVDEEGDFANWHIHCLGEDCALRFLWSDEPLVRVVEIWNSMITWFKENP